MFRNYLKIALRNLLRHKQYSVINIAGLAVGLACCIVILLLVRHELSFDTFHSKADRIYRLYEKITTKGWSLNTSCTQGPAGPAMVADFPEAVKFARFQPAAWLGGYLLHYKDKNMLIEKAYYTDPSFFDVFDFELVSGDAKTALIEPHTAVVTEETARKIFGNEDPLGKVFQDERKAEYKVTGVLKKIPKNSHLQFDILLSIMEMVNQPDHQINNWGIFNFTNYVLLEKGADVKRLEEKLPGFVKKYFASQAGMYEFHLQALRDVHLHSSQISEFMLNWSKGDITYVYVISLLAFAVLLIACFNFMNLSTARSSGRAREVGIRKVVGAQRTQLIKQFLGESVLLSFIALLIAVALIELALPSLNAFFGGVLVFNYLEDWRLLAGLMGIIICVGLIAGSYPAFFLSAFHPVTVLKGTLSAGARGSIFRKTLVVAQFAISIILVISTIIVVQQLQYMQNKNLGFDKDHVLNISMDDNLRRSYKTIQQDLLQNPSITGVTFSSLKLGQRDIFTQHHPTFEGDGSTEDFAVSFLRVDCEFIPFYGLEIVEGRAFSPDLSTDNNGNGGYIINEVLARKLGWNSVQGKKIGSGGNPEEMSPVVGIVKDFNYMSLHSAIEPLLISIGNEEGLGAMSIRIRPGNISQTLDFIKNRLATYSPDRPFEYSFLDEDIAGLYRNEERTAQVISTFALLAVIVACLGLLGLISYAAERRTKEIGIRKVLGASVLNILLLLLKEFLKLLGIAVLIAWPVAWYVMDRWLVNFAYRIEIGWVTFLLGGVIALVIVSLTVSYQTLKAATANPVESLRYE